MVERVYDVKERNSDIYDHSIEVCTIATLIALTLIIAAALGMINSYGFVNKMSEKLKENYFDQYSFANVLAESSYSSYYNALKVNNDKLIEPADVLLDITSNLAI